MLEVYKIDILFASTINYILFTATTLNFIYLNFRTTFLSIHFDRHYHLTIYRFLYVAVSWNGMTLFYEMHLPQNTEKMNNTAQFRTTQNNDEQNNNNDLFQNFHLVQLDRLKIASITSFSKIQKTMKEHHNHIREMIQFTENKHPNYTSQIVQTISNFDSENDQFHWYGSKRDFIYKKNHPDAIKAFMASKKVKNFKILKNNLTQACALQRNPDCRDRIISFEHIRNFLDALLLVVYHFHQTTL